MKNISLVSTAVLFASLFLTCADYDLLDKSLHPEAVTLEVTGVTDSTVTLSWSQFPGADFKNYKVYFSKSDVVETNDSLADSLLFQFDTIKTVSRLTPQTTYYFRVIMNSQNSVFSASNIVSATTLAGKAGALKLFEPESVTDNSVMLRWARYTGADFKYYKVYYALNNGFDTGDSLFATNSLIQDTIATAASLLSDTQYFFRVEVVTQQGASSMSNTVDTTTLLKTNGTLTLFPAENITDSTVMLRWSKCTIKFNRYKVFADTAFFGDSVNILCTVSEQDTFTTINRISQKNLVQGHDYWFRVDAFLDSVKVAKSNVVKASTKP